MRVLFKKFKKNQFSFHPLFNLVVLVLKRKINYEGFITYSRSDR